METYYTRKSWKNVRKCGISVKEASSPKYKMLPDLYKPKKGLVQAVSVRQ